MDEIGDGVGPGVGVVLDDVDDVLRKGVDLPFDVLPYGDQVVELFVGDVLEQGAPQGPVLGDGAEGGFGIDQEPLVAGAVFAAHHLDHRRGDSEGLGHLGVMPEHVGEIDVCDFGVVAHDVLQVPVAYTDEVGEDAGPDHGPSKAGSGDLGRGVRVLVEDVHAEGVAQFVEGLGGQHLNPPTGGRDQDRVGDAPDAHSLQDFADDHGAAVFAHVGGFDQELYFAVGGVQRQRVGRRVGAEPGDLLDGAHDDVRVVGEPAGRDLLRAHNVAFDRRDHRTGLAEGGAVHPLIQKSSDGPCVDGLAAVPKVERVGDMLVVGPLQKVWQDMVQPWQKEHKVGVVDVLHLPIDPLPVVQKPGGAVRVHQLQEIEQVHFGRGVPEEDSSDVGGPDEQGLFQL